MKIFIIFIILFSLYSCEKIKPEIKQVEKKQSNMEACWVTSCLFKEDIENKIFTNKDIPNLDKYTKILSNILISKKDKNELISSIDFQNFANILNKDFFWCDWNIYKCKSDHLNEETKNYLFYIWIPRIVLSLNLEEQWWSSPDIEVVIQSIKRKDFKSSYQKDLEIRKYIKNIDELISTIDLSKIDTDKLKTDNLYFYNTILHPKHWIHDNIVKNIYSINIDWEEENQLAEIVDYTTKSFFDTINKLGISKELFIRKIYEINNYNKENNIISEIIKELEEVSNKIDNSEYNVPINRYFRNDELYIFDWINEKLTEKSEKELLYIRHKVLLLFNLWKEEKLYELTNRLKKYNFENMFILTNFFKYSKYIKTNLNYNL